MVTVELFTLTGSETETKECVKLLISIYTCVFHQTALSQLGYLFLTVTVLSQSAKSI